MPDTCQHREIQTWFIADTWEPAGLWSCKTCGLKFAPLAASRAAALEEAAQIADAAARLEHLMADTSSGSACRAAGKPWTAANLAVAIRERAKT